MRKILFSLSLTLALSVIGLSGLFSPKTTAQGKREIDLTEELRDKQFSDGRRVKLATLPGGETFAAEIREGKWKAVFLILPDGTEVKGKLAARERTTGTTEVIGKLCEATFVTVTTDSDGNKIVTSNTMFFTCPKYNSTPDIGGDNSSNSNSNSNRRKP